jgi:hypothetical protein
MSVELTSLAWRVKFPSPTQKLVLLRLADFASDNGFGVFPSIARLADEVGASERQIQYALRALEGCELISRTDASKSTKKTNEWTIDVELLIKLALRELVLHGKHDTLVLVENKGAIFAPHEHLRVQSATIRVQSATEKGAMGCTQTKENQNNNQIRADARASDEARASPAQWSSAIPSFPITPRDPQWSAWLQRMDMANRSDLVDAAISSEEILVSSKWPKEGLQGLQSVGSVNITDRITGDRS